MPNNRPLPRFERRLHQRFERDASLPGLLHSSEDGYLRQEDDWYILAAEPDR